MEIPKIRLRWTIRVSYYDINDVPIQIRNLRMAMKIHRLKTSFEVVSDNKTVRSQKVEIRLKVKAGVRLIITEGRL